MVMLILAIIDEDDNGSSDIMAYDNHQDGSWDRLKNIINTLIIFSFTIN